MTAPIERPTTATAPANHLMFSFITLPDKDPRRSFHASPGM
jgi:hypothetical protein